MEEGNLASSPFHYIFFFGIDKKLMDLVSTSQMPVLLALVVGYRQLHGGSVQF